MIPGFMQSADNNQVKKYRVLICTITTGNTGNL